jgi:hypothetical protein
MLGLGYLPSGFYWMNVPVKKKKMSEFWWGSKQTRPWLYLLQAEDQLQEKQNHHEKTKTKTKAQEKKVK